ncbi:hypothetical protein KSI01_08570 [Kurthia sibirica]|nr:hypothetical protein KSI01_08570 [Kurthia sibirica]
MYRRNDHDIYHDGLRNNNSGNCTRYCCGNNNYLIGNFVNKIEALSFCHKMTG